MVRYLYAHETLAGLVLYADMYLCSETCHNRHYDQSFLTAFPFSHHFNPTFHTSKVFKAPACWLSVGLILNNSVSASPRVNQYIRQKMTVEIKRPPSDPIRGIQGVLENSRTQAKGSVGSPRTSDRSFMESW